MSNDLLYGAVIIKGYQLLYLPLHTIVYTHSRVGRLVILWAYTQYCRVGRLVIIKGYQLLYIPTSLYYSIVYTQSRVGCLVILWWNLESFYKTRSFYAIFCIVVFLGGENRGKVNRWNFLILENEKNNRRFFYFSFPVEVWPANGIYKLVSQTPSRLTVFDKTRNFYNFREFQYQSKMDVLSSGFSPSWGKVNITIHV